MELGINLPWLAYGADLGDALVHADKTSVTASLTRYNSPPPTPQVNKVRVSNLLQHRLAVIKEIGITKVRWILLGDGWNIGPAPQLHRDRWSWDVRQIKVPKGYQADFEAILDIFLAMGMQIVPSLANDLLISPGRIPFAPVGGKHFEYLPDRGATSVKQAVNNYLSPRKLALDTARSVDFEQFIKGGKQDILKDQDSMERFYAALLDPLLKSAGKAKYRKTVTSWEVFSEPDLIFANWSNNRRKKNPDPYWADVSRESLQLFLAIGIQKVYGAGLIPSIGFQRPGNMLEYLRAPLLANCIAKNGGAFERNFHFYPESNDEDTPISLVTGAVVGEFATKPHAWHDILLSPQWPDDIAIRLQILSDYGITAAYPWAAEDDEWSSFSAVNQAAMAKFIADNTA